MYTSTILATGFAALTAAAPSMSLEARQSTCPAFPWFLTPFDAPGCTGNPGPNATSGPVIIPPPSQGCTLLTPEAAPFASVAVNPNACPGDEYTISLFSDSACATPPIPVTVNSCVDAAAVGALPFVAFTATPIVPSAPAV